MGLDSFSESRLSEVHPMLAEKIRAMADALEAQGVSIRVTQGLRTWDEQAALYAKGRTAPGPKVTNASAGTSWHNYGLAVDVVPMTPLGPDWNTSHPVWQAIITTGEAQGLVAGAKWRSFPDYPHFQLTGTLPVSPDEGVREAYEQGGVTGVWTAAGLALPSDGTVSA